MFNEQDLIEISFNQPFDKNFKKLYFSPNKDILYYDNSHLNYIYEIEIENIKYTFYGFFKNNFFVIIYNSYHKELNISIENKNIILIKLDWILQKYNDNNESIYVIDKLKFNDTPYYAIIIPYRNKFFKENNINIEDYLKIIDFKTIKVELSEIDSLNKKTFPKYTFSEKILSLIRLYDNPI